MTQKQREHYEYMLENMELSERHRWWILKQLEQE
jgi:hypothetical protein